MSQHRVASAEFSHREGRSERMLRGKTQRRVPADFDRKCFEFDRDIVEGVLDELRSALSRAAIEMTTVAGQLRFDASLSEGFSRTAKRLSKMVGNLEELLGDVRDATGYPNLSDLNAIAQRVSVPLSARK